MKLLTPLLALLGQATVVLSANYCPVFQGPEFPPPRNLHNHPVWQQAMDNITALWAWLDSDVNGTTGAKNYSYSVQLWSAIPDTPPILWERFHTADDVAAGNYPGVKKVDGDTVYRLGSVTKVYTVLTWLAAVGDEQWNEPVTRYVPEIREWVERNKESKNEVYQADWEDVSIGSLATQLTGTIRDCESHQCPPAKAEIERQRRTFTQ